MCSAGGIVSGPLLTVETLDFILHWRMSDSAFSQSQLQLGWAIVWASATSDRRPRAAIGPGGHPPELGDWERPRCIVCREMIRMGLLLKLCNENLARVIQPEVVNHMSRGTGRGPRMGGQVESRDG